MTPTYLKSAKKDQNQFYFSKANNTGEKKKKSVCVCVCMEGGGGDKNV